MKPSTLGTITVVCGERVLSWSNGRLYGDDMMLEAAEEATRMGAYISISPNLPPLPANHYDTEHVFNVIAALSAFNPNTTLVHDMSDNYKKRLSTDYYSQIRVESYVTGEIEPELTYALIREGKDDDSQLGQEGSDEERGFHVQG